MQLELLQEIPTISVFYDHTNEWLFADWYGELTLPLVQANCLAIAQCFLQGHTYKRVLNSNLNMSSVVPEAPLWLATNYLPHMGLGGVEYLAWVYPNDLLLRPLIDRAVRKLTTPAVTMFDDLESACTWLQHAHLPHLTNAAPTPPSAATQTKLDHQVSTLAATVQAYEQVGKRFRNTTL
ncbi:MAG: hypothetical protein ACRYFK_16595 [Janthinobacterium lividum]